MSANDKPLNILWITTDRQRHDTLGCYGNPHVRTPILDALATDGVVMEQAWCQSPICGPSRASFLTGRYPRTARVNRNAQMIPPDEKLISRLLADAGYVCGHAGKMHLAPSSPPLADWCEPRIDDGYASFEWSMHPPDVPVCAYTAWLVEHGIEFKREPVYGKDFSKPEKDGAARQAAIKDEHGLDGPPADESASRFVTFGMDDKTSNTAWVAQRAINFATVSARLNRPWFFTMNIEDPHNPFDPPRRFLEPYLENLEAIPLPNYTPGELDNKPAFQNICRKGAWGGGGGLFAWEGMTDNDHRLIRASYWAMCDHIDYQVGRVMQMLRETDQLDNTLVIFMSDHGEMLGDHGFYFQGGYFYEEMMHVPLIMSCPSRLKPGRLSGLVELTDLAPTLLEAAGAEAYPGMQGRSFWKQLTGKADGAHIRDNVYFEYYRAIPNGYRRLREDANDAMSAPPMVTSHGFADEGAGFLTGLRDEHHAITVVHDRDEGELYDLGQDPGMVHNLWDDPDHAALKIRMFKKLCDRMAGTIDPLPATQAAY